MNAPVPAGMVRELDGRTDLIVKQSRRGCLQECLGCEAKTAFRIAPADAPSAAAFYVEEDSNCCLRTCCPAVRPWTTTLSLGDSAGGEPLVRYDRPVRCPPGGFKCCCYQSVSATDARTGAPIGAVREQCYVCVPSLAVMDHTGSITHVMHQPTCCFGTCVDPCHKSGGGCCKVPFDIYAVRDGRADETEPVGRVVKAYGGAWRELSSDADTVALTAPPGTSGEEMARLLGATLLINELYFEGYGAANADEGKEGGFSLM